MTLTNTQLNELKNDLLSMRKNLKEQDSAEQAVENDPDELNVADNHLADSAGAFVDRQQQIAESSLNEEQLTQVNEALERISDGSYGICVDTGKEIPFERLKAIPYTKRTVKAENSYRRQQNQTATAADDNTSKLLKPSGQMEDSRNRTLERIEKEHNTIERADDPSRFNEEPNDQTKW
ncbi:TraR/DksA family transcriptional regulator [Virgibacillus siamensis]|uniref:TraR/DksA family transcriptional regulator n=1 Tax=Virgibacillus siamensis TaxID=480071 RepID=UPI0009841D80|nr:TraR/DksA C4-type zinc finger protein [Virgibacillus siamensis]